ncbi:MAG: Gfo/Idh/MocA family oxidoreductase [Thermoguttaceae bacterium]|nr:Gfo/Idh/MocA family oxidoreductase [Thermoguttaceae bacterium]MDW8036821.1 Gfo/Idh/MocA family oxidoreductase [Thermoguttaceae bacterium]
MQSPEQANQKQAGVWNATRSAERKIRVGLVGLGSAWEQRYRPALRSLADRFEVRAVCEQVRCRAEQAAAQLGADVVDGFRSLIAREDVEAILMLAPQWYGPLPIFAACEMGKAVYCATGLELDLQQAEQIARRVRQAGIPFMAELARRHAPATVRLKELIATRLGRPQLVFCHLRGPRTDPTTLQSNGLGSCPAEGELVELVDWCCYLVGQEPTYVTGLVHAYPSQREQEDYVLICLDFSRPDEPSVGPLAQINYGRYIPAGWEEVISYRRPAALQIKCEQGIVFLDLPATVVWFDEAGRHLESLGDERPVGERLLSQFYRLLLSPVVASQDLDALFRALYIVHQARRSHSLGQRIRLDWPQAQPES